MPYARDFIFGRLARKGRAQRYHLNCTREERAAGAGHRGVVTVLELPDGQYEELDAQDALHGRCLADDWVKRGSAKTASVWAVQPDGTMGECLFLSDGAGEEMLKVVVE